MKKKATKAKSNAPRNLDSKKMRNMYMKGYAQSAIARRFDCRINAVAHHIHDLIIPTPNNSRNNLKLTSKKVKKIRSLFIYKKMSSTVLASMFNVSQSTILNVVHGVFYRWVPGKIILRSGKIVEISPVLDKTLNGRKINRKGIKKSGPNKNSVRLAPVGSLKHISKKHGVSPCTISRRIRTGKINIKKELKALSKKGIKF